MFLRDVKPGEMVVISDDGLKSIQIENPDDKYPRVRYFQLVENTMISKGFALCMDKRCQANHQDTIQEKYLL